LLRFVCGSVKVRRVTGDVTRCRDLVIENMGILRSEGEAGEAK
jgi:hypothetical protein